MIMLASNKERRRTNMQIPRVVMACIFLIVALLVPMTSLGQSAGSKGLRTHDGKPDIQGTFTFATLTPMQRPTELQGKETLSEAEAAVFEAKENDRLDHDRGLRDPKGDQTLVASN